MNEQIDSLVSSELFLTRTPRHSYQYTLFNLLEGSSNYEYTKG